MGDAVWVRQRGSRCIAKSQQGEVNKIISPQIVEVDGVPRHIHNLRHWVEAAADFRPLRSQSMVPKVDDDDHAVSLMPIKQSPAQLAIEGPPSGPPCNPARKSYDEAKAASPKELREM